MDNDTHAHTSFVTKPPFPPCASLLLTCPVTPLRSWVLRRAAHLPPPAHRTQRMGLPQPVTKLDLEQMFKGLAPHHTSCFRARAFVTDSWVALSQLCKADVWGWGEGRLLSAAGRQKFRAALCEEFSDFATYPASCVNSSLQRSSCTKSDLPIFLCLDSQWVSEKGEGYALELFWHWFLHHSQRWAKLRLRVSIVLEAKVLES